MLKDKWLGGDRRVFSITHLRHIYLFNDVYEMTSISELFMGLHQTTAEPESVA